MNNSFFTFSSAKLTFFFLVETHESYRFLKRPFEAGSIKTSRGDLLLLEVFCFLFPNRDYCFGFATSKSGWGFQWI